MKIFFIASIHGKEKFDTNYRKIVEFLRDAGYRTSAEHILNVTASELDSWDDSKDIAYHKKVLTGIKRSDFVVAELSYSSTSVGYLVSLAVESGKPTIAFYSGKEMPHLLTTLKQSRRFQVVHYDDVNELKAEIPALVDYATEQMDTRFNFFISRKLDAYLNWISRKRRIPRAVYLRQLIRKEMRRNTEF